jgi:hypothetical protein
MNFLSTQVSSMMKTDYIPNFAIGGIINRRTQHNSLCKDKNKHWLTSYVIVYKALSHVTLLGMRKLSLACTVVA